MYRNAQSCAQKLRILVSNNDRLRFTEDVENQIPHWRSKVRIFIVQYTNVEFLIYKNKFRLLYKNLSSQVIYENNR
jgi:hypothetical protein